MDNTLTLNAIGFVGLLSISLLCVAQPIRQPALTVVYDSGNTIDATPYYGKRLRSSEISNGGTVVPTAPIAPARSVDIADNLPLVSQRLSPGQLSVKQFEGVTTPFFVMGMDEQSLTWLEDAATVLVGLNAVGFVVQADNRKDWLQLERFASDHGIRLSLLNGDSLARKYGLTTYPSVITGREAIHEQ